VIGEQAHKGLWWLPGDESEKLSGTLMVTKGEASLELLGHFGYEILYETETEKIASGSLAEQPRILGLTHDGKHVTFEGHVSAPSTEHFPGIPIATCTRSVTLTNRYGAPLYVPPPDEGDPSPVDGTVFREGDRLPVGVDAFPGMEPNDLVFWVESHRALVAGDTLQDRGNGLQFLGDLSNNVPAELGVGSEQILEGMQPLLALPVEIVLLTHGAPADRAALERALATPPS
jgi:hypothetical protein